MKKTRQPPAWKKLGPPAVLLAAALYWAMAVKPVPVNLGFTAFSVPSGRQLWRTLTVKPTPPGRIGLWFAALGNDPQHVRRTGLMNSLKQKAQADPLLSPLVEVRALDEAVEAESDAAGHELARRLGAKHNAGLLVWGCETAVSSHETLDLYVTLPSPIKGASSRLGPLSVGFPAPGRAGVLIVDQAVSLLLNIARLLLAQKVLAEKGPQEAEEPLKAIEKSLEKERPFLFSLNMMEATSFLTLWSQTRDKKHFRLAKSRFQSAARLCRDAASARPCVEAWEGLADLHQKAGLAEQAVKFYRKAAAFEKR